MHHRFCPGTHSCSVAVPVHITKKKMAERQFLKKKKEVKPKRKEHTHKKRKAVPVSREGFACRCGWGIIWFKWLLKNSSQNCSMHFLPGYCWKYGAEYFLWCFKPICSGSLRAGPCALHSCFQFAVAWSATLSSWDAPKWEVLWGAGITKTQGTRNISLGSSREAASF